MDNGVQHYIYIYVCIYSLLQLNIKAGVFKNIRVVSLSRSLNFLRTLAYGAVSSSLGKFCPTLGEFDHHFLPRGKELDKKITRVAEIKNFPGDCPGGCTQLELAETY